jgi:hypothetical protein
MASDPADIWFDDIDIETHGPFQWPRARQMLREFKQGLPGAVAAALADVARSPGSMVDGDPATIFLTAMGWRESYLPIFRRYGGTHPIDPSSTATPAQLARVFGANARKAAAEDAQRVRDDPQAAIEAIEPVFAAAQAKAVELCRLLAQAMEEFAYGNVDVAKERRDEVIKAWNAFGRDPAWPTFPFPLLCEFCGKPLIIVAKERKSDGKQGRARVHPECREARKALRARGRKRGSR